ncbi:TonB-dependent receptor [Hymenobacter weizhouensis]|uniref:TonB-dependent receptor n=1 Tax=Hymenobacter sp. YIM 151500-1 TaxID=2987689 RepID=UPI0022278276|nr:TonB-dependent receptor [Hymenobacter sp. YIM 151500-1]UYZ62729.1 TonB-dependent receptor [Hymenobacter sp. YIM 151500-1]
MISTQTAMLFRRVFFLIFMCLAGALGAAQAQTGTIKGTIRDEKTKEAIIGASVGIEGTGLGAATDLDGSFEIGKVPAGTHTLVVNYVSYQRKTIPNLQVDAGKVVVINTALTESANQLGDVVVTAQRLTNTEVAVITEVKNAQLVAVGVSSEQIVKSQDRDAAQIARRVPGVSIQDNRFVLVRGLTQRYNAVMLNDVLTPSSEVDTRAFAFDMIPSNIIDRMLIFKSGSAELPGDFAGGVIKVYTKRAPQENFTNVSFGGGYRFGTTFSEVQKYEGGKYDWLGFDSGKRTIPDNWPARLSDNSFSPELRAAFGRQLPNRWDVNTIKAAPDARLSFNLGRRYDIGEKQFGILTSLNYGNYHLATSPRLTSYELGEDRSQVSVAYNDQLYNNEVRLGVVQNFWLRLNNRNSLEFKNLFNQLGAAETVVRQGRNITQTSNDELAYSQRFESRSIYSGQLIGNHELANDKTKLDWVGGFAYTYRTEPDWRRARYTRPIGATNGDGTLVPFALVTPAEPNPTDAGRFFSKLNERVGTVALNAQHTFRADSSNREGGFKMKAGVYGERKDRDFNARFFGYNYIGGPNSTARTLPIGQIFAPENLTGRPGAFSLEEGTNPSDEYTATSTLLSGYASVTLPVGKFTGTVGFRGEYMDLAVNGILLDRRPGRGGFTLFSPLPSVNLTYDLNDRMLVRAAYSSTINRPEFRELAPFRYYDFNLNGDIQGNLSLRTARIQNLDLRWELYPSSGELVTVGAFYKRFTDPIESFLSFTAGGPSTLGYAFINAQGATSYGTEIEVRKSLSSLTSSTLLRRLSLAGNASFIISRVDLGNPVLVPDAGGVVTPIDPGDTQIINRPLQGQSPYLINLGTYYSSEDNSTQVSLLYNVVGPRIFAVGNKLNPTVFEVPRNVMDIIVTKRLAKNWELRAAVQDVFNQPVQLDQDTDRNGKHSSGDNTVRTYRRGSYSSVGLTYTW